MPRNDPARIFPSRLLCLETASIALSLYEYGVLWCNENTLEFSEKLGSLDG